MVYVLGDAPVKTSFDWLTEYAITYSYGSPGEVGVDIGTPYGTPITSLTDGTVLATGYPSGVGGIVSVSTRIDGQPATWYVQHLDLIVVQAGDRVQPGALLGYSGGQLSGGNHPASPPYSTGPHTEVGVNSPYGGLANPRHDSPSMDPIPWLQDMARGVGGSAFAALGTNLAKTTTTAAGFLPIAQALDAAEQFQGFDITNPWGSLSANAGAFFVRAIFVVLGIAVILAVISWYLRRQAPQLGALAALAA